MTYSSKGMPEKRSMNLYYKPDRASGSAAAALYALLGLILLLAVIKFGIYDLAEDLRASREELARVQAQEQQYAQQLSDYDDVARRYRLYAATQEESSATDRLDILALLDETVRSKATVESVSIAGANVDLQLSGVTLAQTAEIVRSIRASDLVLSVSVNAAASDPDGGSPDRDDPSKPVSASVSILLARESEADIS